MSGIKKEIYSEKEVIRLKSEYQKCFESFLRENQLHEQDDRYIPSSANRSNLDFDKQRDKFIGLEDLTLLDNRLRIEGIFSHLGFKPVEPLPIVNIGGNTLFVSAGVQIIDDIIHREGQLISIPRFVAQPVLRTQYIDGVAEGSSTSFVNVSTEAVNVDPKQHFNYFQKWLELFYSLGMSPDKFTFSHRFIEKTWGSKSFDGFEFFIYYDDLEIGDASFNYNVPQDTRRNITFSDIGFGLERIKWVLRGGSYFDNFTSRPKSEISLPALAFANTLTLLSGSDLKPSNKEYGYRFRLFSKRFVDEVKGQYKDFDNLFAENYKYWSKWTNLSISEVESLERIKKENSRNFNRLLLDQIKIFYSDVGLDINLPTNVLLQRLGGTSVPSQIVNKLLINLNYQK